MEVWVNADSPYTKIGSRPRCFVQEDVTLIADGAGLAMFDDRLHTCHEILLLLTLLMQPGPIRKGNHGGKMSPQLA